MPIEPSTLKAVEATVSLWRRTKFEWGKTDCILSVCDHVQAVTGIDPAAPWRGTYDSQDGAQAIHEAYGGVLALMDHGMALAGLSRCEPSCGLPVVADVRGNAVAGVQGEHFVAFRLANQGVFQCRAKILGAWRI